jgi:hypothetical protein
LQRIDATIEASPFGTLADGQQRRRN